MAKKKMAGFARKIAKAGKKPVALTKKTAAKLSNKKRKYLILTKKTPAAAAPTTPAEDPTKIQPATQKF